MTLDDIKSYLRIDGTDEDTYLSELIEASQIYVDSCVGEGYKLDVKALKLADILQKKLISDMYENRSTFIQEKSSSEKTKQDRIVTTILDKLSGYEVVT